MKRFEVHATPAPGTHFFSSNTPAIANHEGFAGLFMPQDFALRDDKQPPRVRKCF
ncbi:hypothetical protein ACLS0R_02730 [Comamonas jiangduensis]|uniref:hypothetical protein n=1 Tax=Comamonas jiangduensis TaxID=1194168 RepID=UPI003BF7985F